MVEVEPNYLYYGLLSLSISYHSQVQTKHKVGHVRVDVVCVYIYGVERIKLEHVTV